MRALIALGLTGCWTGSQPTTLPRPEPAPEPSYRASTIAVDAVGVAAMAIGMVAVQRGHDDAGHGLAAGGLVAAGYVSPIIHLANGHKARAGASWLMRSLAATTGMVIGLGAARCDREPTLGQLDCSLNGMMWGVAGGLAVGSVIDALTLHGDTTERTWVPTVVPDHGGASVGIAGGF